MSAMGNVRERKYPRPQSVVWVTKEVHRCRVVTFIGCWFERRRQPEDTLSNADGQTLRRHSINRMIDGDAVQDADEMAQQDAIAIRKMIHQTVNQSIIELMNQLNSQ